MAIVDEILLYIDIIIGFVFQIVNLVILFTMIDILKLSLEDKDESWKEKLSRRIHDQPSKQRQLFYIMILVNVSIDIITILIASWFFLGIIIITKLVMIWMYLTLKKKNVISS